MELIESCSERVKKGVEYLEKMIKDDKLKHICYNSPIYYALSKVNSRAIENLNEESKKVEFWWTEKDDGMSVWLLENSDLFWYLSQLELYNNEFFQQSYISLKASQTIDGKIGLNSEDHTPALRILNFLEPESAATKNATKYFLDNWKDYDSEYNWDIKSLLIGIIALSEIDFLKYKNSIEEIIRFILTKQNDDGYFGKEYGMIELTSLAIIALSRFRGITDKNVSKSIEWLKSKQTEYGFWEEEERKHFSYYAEDTAYALLALFSIGEGPKISIEEQEWKEMLRLQEKDYMKPYFIHTSPIYESRLHVKEIHEKTRSMILSAEKEVRIASLFIDMLYEDLIDFCNEKKDVKFKIITRPAKEVEGLRQKIGKNVIELLNIATKGNMRYNELMHCRMLIIDDKEMIVSSADLTREQLFDEFNAGIYTKDSESIRKAIKFFENIWENSEEFKK